MSCTIAPDLSVPIHKWGLRRGGGGDRAEEGTYQAQLRYTLQPAFSLPFLLQLPALMTLSSKPLTHSAEMLGFFKDGR